MDDALTVVKPTTHPTPERFIDVTDDESIETVAFHWPTRERRDTPSDVRFIGDVHPSFLERDDVVSVLPDEPEPPPGRVANFVLVWTSIGIVYFAWCQVLGVL